MKLPGKLALGAFLVLAALSPAQAADLGIRLDELPPAFERLQQILPDTPRLESVGDCQQQDDRRVCTFRAGEDISLIAIAGPDTLSSATFQVPVGSVANETVRLAWGGAMRAAVLVFSAGTDLQSAAETAGRLSQPAGAGELRLGQARYDTSRSDAEAWRVDIVPSDPQ